MFFNQGPMMPDLSPGGILAALPHPAHLQQHMSTLIVTPLPITHVIRHATLLCPRAEPAAQKRAETGQGGHVSMSLELWC